MTDHGALSWPPDPEDYEVSGFDPESTEEDVDRLFRIARAHHPRAPESLTWLDLAAGTGRHARELAARGAEVIAADRALGWLHHGRQLAAQEAAEANPGSARGPIHWIGCDLGNLPLAPGSADVAFCLFNTLLEVIENPTAIGLFRRLHTILGPEGLLVIDNFCVELWGEVSDGFYANGIASDGSSQMIWEVGENTFCLRRGDEVDPDNWAIEPADRRYRLWSQRELTMLAALTGFDELARTPDFVFRPR